MKQNKTKNRITPKDSIYSIRNNEYLQKAHVYILNEEIFEKFRLLSAIITRMYKIGKVSMGFNPQDNMSLVNGLNSLIENVENNVEVFHQIYKDAEIEVDPSKSKTGVWYFPVKEKTPFIIVCPGGAYQECVAIGEGYPIANGINKMGYSAFVLKYRIGKNGKNLCQMDDLVQAVRYIIDRADQFNVDPNNYAVMGFSAGGHLTASYGTKHLGYRKYNLPPPSALILSYAAISMYHLTHKKMKETLMGKNPTKELMDKYSIEKNVDKNYPPTFTWRCEEDDQVQDEHRTALVESLKKFNIMQQSELYSGGKHGINLGIGTDAEKWLKQSLDFWKTASE